MPSISSYFNPASKEHHAIADFKNLSGGKKFLTVLLTVLATIASVPIAGLGGVAAFRALTNKFSVLDLNLKTKATQTAVRTNERVLDEIEKHKPDPNVIKMLNESWTQTPAIGVSSPPHNPALTIHEFLTECSAESAIEALKLLDVNQQDSNKNSLIHIACLRRDFDEVVLKMLDNKSANFDLANKDGDFPITLYTKNHLRDTNEEIYKRMVLNMKDLNSLRTLILKETNPSYLRPLLKRVSDLGNPYKLEAYTTTTELFLVLLEKANSQAEIDAIVKYYGTEDDLFSEERRDLNQSKRDLAKAITDNPNIIEAEKGPVLEKLK